MIRAALWIAALLAAGACAAELPEGSAGVAARREAIVDGSPEPGNRGVVFLYNLEGAACTASIISPRVVLTAKHCVQDRPRASAAPASRFRVYVGSSVRALSAEYLVQEIRVAPGCWDLCGDSSDVAVLILSTPAAEPPLEVTFDSPSSLAGQTITAVGYGQTPGGTSGTRLRTQKRVTEVYSGLVFVEPAVCSGDSGGPLIGPDGRVYGVASFIFSPDRRTEPTCGTAPGAYNAIDRYRALIEGAIEESGVCIPDGVEVCDGDDDNCDGEIDETCTPLGEPCATSDECVGNRCADTPIGRVCTRECNPLTPEVGCGPGLYCARAGACDGACLPHTGAADRGVGMDCDADSQCDSLFCADPGDGRRRCLDPCRGEAGMCLAGEACAAAPDRCGGCVPAGLVASVRGIGEPCDEDDECRSMQCFEDVGVRYCSRPCATDGECPSGFHCRAAEVCVRGPRGAVGAGCVTNDDCADGALCAARGDSRWCTTTCVDAGGCPAGFECTEAGAARVCAPAAGLVGEECAEAADCISGLCVDAPAGRVCVRRCDVDNPCEAGLECVRTADGIVAVCAPPAPRAPRDEGGCRAVPGPIGGAGAGMIVLLSLTLLARRRRLR